MDAQHLTADEAEELTSKIVQVGTRYVSLVIAAHNGRADKALGYRTWDAYVKARLRDAPRVSVGERKELVAELRKEGMSSRAIAPVVGASAATVKRDISTGSNEPVAEVVSLDGRRRPGHGTSRSPRKSSALTRRLAAARDASDALTRWPKDFAAVDEETRWEAVRILTATIGNAEALIQALDVAGTLTLTPCRIAYHEREAK